MEFGSWPPGNGVVNSVASYERTSHSFRTDAGRSIPGGDIRISPDLAVEVLSPNDLTHTVDQKITEYFEAGGAVPGPVLVSERNPPVDAVSHTRQLGLRLDQVDV